MTEHEKKRQAEADRLVSQGYRDVATERTPERLNQAVLRRASEAARPKLSLTRAWTRPLAWAATIALSVALVLEVSKVPAPDAISFDSENNAYEQPKPEVEVLNDTASDAAAVGVLEETEAPPASVAAPREAAAFRTQATQPSLGEALERATQDPDRRDTAPSIEGAAATADADAFKSESNNMLRQADEMARLRAGENKERDTAGAEVKRSENAGRIASLASFAAESGCSETARSSAATWLLCIEELERAGNSDEAKRQREALQEAFPDFKPE